MHAEPTTRSATTRSISGMAPQRGVLHLWLKARGEAAARVSVSVAGQPPLMATTARTDDFDFAALDLPAAGPLKLHWDGQKTEVSLAYVFTPEKVGAEGITLLMTTDRNSEPDQPGSYHFRPPFGWMNDPNGFGRFHGLGHLFYQHHPHGRRWDTMHWGHAVSDDFLHWRHQPVFLLPPEVFATEPGLRGGAFSGSAMEAEGGGLRVFFTDHVDDREPEQEMQATALSRDGLRLEPPVTILPSRPEGLGLTRDFRDPFVLKGPDGRWQMLLGSRDKSAGVVLLYTTDDPSGVSGWQFTATLLREERYGMTAAECPCLVPLDGPAEDPAARWGLFFGLLTSRDPATGRRNLTIATVGRFDGKSFIPEFEQELDFGTDAYAFQAFPDADGPIGIAWLANWTDIVKTADFPTAMTLPRRLLLRGDALLTPPVEGVLALRKAEITCQTVADGLTLDLGNGAAEILIELAAPGTPFTLILDCDDATLELAVVQDAAGLAIRHQPQGRTAPNYAALGARVSRLRIFLDSGSIEVFADDGRWTGTKRLAGLATPRSARLTVAGGGLTACRAFALSL